VTTLIAAGALIAAMLAAPVAHADNGQWVCELINQGVTVPEITKALQGDPRVSRYDIEKALWAVVDQQCGRLALY
jgi:23S rRNA A1618 N6-methylase RlmF